MREHVCDPWHRAGFDLEWVCPVCSQTWAYLSTVKGTGWYRAGVPARELDPPGGGSQ